MSFMEHKQEHGEGKFRQRCSNSRGWSEATVNTHTQTHNRVWQTVTGGKCSLTIQNLSASSSEL